MILNSISIDASLRVKHLLDGEEQWDKILNLLTLTTESAILKGFADLFFFDFPNGNIFGKNISEDVNISNVLIGIGDGTTTSFSFSLTPYPIKPSSLSIAYTINDNIYTATDDGNGNILGTEITSASISYNDGTGSLDFNTPPDAGTAITANFMRGVSTDDSLLAGFKFVLSLDENPSLSQTPFTSIVPLTVAPTIIDWYQTETTHIYRAVMQTSYTDTESIGPVTAVGIVYQGIEGSASGTSEKDIYILKSITPFKTDLYGSDGLILTNLCEITVDFRIIMKK